MPLITPIFERQARKLWSTIFWHDSTRKWNYSTLGQRLQSGPFKPAAPRRRFDDGKAEYLRHIVHLLKEIEEKFCRTSRTRLKASLV